MPNATAHLARALLLVALCLTCVSAQAADAPWWDARWPDRYTVELNDIGVSSSAEVAIVHFRADLSRRGDPYDLRAVDDSGATVPMRVLYWKPEGDITCLLGVDPSAPVRRLRLYLGNPDAPLSTDFFAWRDPTLLIGSQMDRAYQRHGEWIWNADSAFDAVHIGSTTGRKRVSHWVTRMAPTSCHPSRMRLTQMVWIDPAAPAHDISIEFMFDKRTVSTCWTDEEAPPGDVVGHKAVKIGPLPTPGQWTRLEVRSQHLDLVRHESLKGMGFTNHGGFVKWGPTAMGAMPTYARVVKRERMSDDDQATSHVTEIVLDSNGDTAPAYERIHLSVSQAPLFAIEGSPLLLTYFVHFAHDFTGDPPDCELNLVAIDEAGERRPIVVTPTPFTGGDQWQRTIELSAEQWGGAQSIEAGLMADGVEIRSASLRLEEPAPMRGLVSNGALPQLGDDVVTFVLPPGGSAGEQTVAPTNGKATLLLTADVRPVATDTVVPINSDDARLGLTKRVSTHTRRAASDWIVAAARAARSGHFGSARVIVDPDLIDIGLPLGDIGPFLHGLAALVGSGETPIALEIDLSSLRGPDAGARDRAMLTACLEALAHAR